MDTDRIREARLRQPFRPLVLRTNSGERFLVAVPEHLAVSRRAVVVVNSATETPVFLDPSEVASLDFADELASMPPQ